MVYTIAMADSIAILLLAALGAALLSVWIALALRSSRRARWEKEPSGPKPKNCPLCGSSLGPNERVKSVLFPGKGDRLMHVFGCPYCLPGIGQLVRICPACREKVPDDGYVIGRFFERPGKKHLHVLGCTGCRERGLTSRGT
jgi:hypothetical protein